MSELVFEKLSEESLQQIAGGVTPELRAAYSCIYGEFGNGDERVRRLRAAGYDPARVQNLVNELVKYESVAKDVIAGKYGNGDARINNLRAAGYNPYAVQDLVNNIVLDHQLY